MVRRSGLLEKAKVGVNGCLDLCFEHVGFADAKEVRVDPTWFWSTRPVASAVGYALRCRSDPDDQQGMLRMHSPTHSLCAQVISPLGQVGSPGY